MSGGCSWTIGSCRRYTFLSPTNCNMSSKLVKGDNIRSDLFEKKKQVDLPTNTYVAPSNKITFLKPFRHFVLFCSLYLQWCSKVDQKFADKIFLYKLSEL